MEGFLFRPFFIVALIKLLIMPFLHLYDNDIKHDFYPLTVNNHIMDLKLGLLTIRDKWKYLAAKQQINLTVDNSPIHDSSKGRSISASYLPTSELNLLDFLHSEQSPETFGLRQLSNLWDLTQLNAWSIHQDISILGLTDSSTSVPAHVKRLGNHAIYLGKDVVLEHCTLNTTDGPIHIADHVQIMDGASLRGPLSIGNNSIIKMGATIYGGTSIGEHCVIGGEIKNSIINSYSNKSHHGYIGDSYIGSWCNLGAGTTCSNVKNTLGDIKLWNIHQNKFNTAVNKVGVFMGDHVRTAINTSINSGTVIGPFSTIFEFSTISSKYIPSFAWGGKSTVRYELEKLLSETEKWMAAKGQSLDSIKKDTIRTLYLQLNKN